MSVSETMDTILVDRGVYHELIRFPAHQLTLMSNYERSLDSLDITETVVNGSTFTDVDSATLVVMDSGCASGNVLSGFTLTGARGILFDTLQNWHTAGVFLVRYNSPAIRHNVITDNSCEFRCIGWFLHSSVDFMANEIRDNVFLHESIDLHLHAWELPAVIRYNRFLANPRSPRANYPGLYVTGGEVQVLDNTFQGLSGRADALLSYGGRDLTFARNIIDGCQALESLSSLILVIEDDVVIEDNVFRNCEVEGSAGLVFSNGRNVFTLQIVGNVFENMHCLGLPNEFAGEGCFHIQSYPAEIRHNIFSNCVGPSCGAFDVVIGTQPVVVENNIFEACSASYNAGQLSGAILRNSDQPLNGRYNIFVNNYPGAVGSLLSSPHRPMDFRNNYWGHPSGPFQPDSNAQGQGDAISADIIFSPWEEDTSFAAVDNRRTSPLADHYSLYAYPNPFNSEVHFRIAVSRPGRYELALYSVIGARMDTRWVGAIVNDRTINVSATTLSSGVYFAALLDEFGNPLGTPVKTVLIK